jgi:hypothetical protein
VTEYTVIPDPDPDPTTPRAGPLRSEPVVVSNSIALIVIVLATLLPQLGVNLPAAWDWLLGALVAGGSLTGATVVARRLATPVVDPRDNTGRRLVPDQSPRSGA